LKKKMLVFFRAFFRVFSENYIMSEKVCFWEMKCSMYYT
jgi:hypothetical protein